MPRSNPSSVGYARGTQVTTQLTARETFGGPAKAGLGRHIGMGEFDLFVSRRANVGQDWKTPENIGYPINTYKVENSLIVVTDGITAYYASNKSGYGLEDIFYFSLPEEKQATQISDLELKIIYNQVPLCFQMLIVY